MAEISVIVPVYNVERYLRKSLDSVCSQSFTDIEIICVNDGSTDNSLDILNEYAKKDERLKIINQENQGLGASRNRGLKESTGKYICFIDPDDYIDLKTLEKLHYNACENDSDMVIFKFQSFGSHKKETGFLLDKIFGNVDYNHFKFTYHDVRPHVLNAAYSACTKLYKKEFLDTYPDFYFPQNLYYEDILFHVKVMLRASAISFVPEELYYYRLNPRSISNLSGDPFDIFKIIDLVEDFLKSEDYYNEFEEEFIKFKLAQILKYLFLTNSEEYFQKTKSVFEKMNAEKNDLIKGHIYNSYHLVLSSHNYEQFIFTYYDKRISKLKKQNKKLKRQNRNLKHENREILSSRSWRITKPLRFLRNLKK